MKPTLEQAMQLFQSTQNKHICNDMIETVLNQMADEILQYQPLNNILYNTKFVVENFNNAQDRDLLYELTRDDLLPQLNITDTRLYDRLYSRLQIEPFYGRSE